MSLGYGLNLNLLSPSMAYVRTLSDVPVYGTDGSRSITYSGALFISRYPLLVSPTLTVITRCTGVIVAVLLDQDDALIVALSQSH